MGIIGTAVQQVKRGFSGRAHFETEPDAVAIAEQLEAKIAEMRRDADRLAAAPRPDARAIAALAERRAEIAGAEQALEQLRSATSPTPRTR